MRRNKYRSHRARGRAVAEDVPGKANARSPVVFLRADNLAYAGVALKHQSGGSVGDSVRLQTRAENVYQTVLLLGYRQIEFIAKP